MEPMIPGDDRDELSDLALELVSKASALAGQVHGQVQEGIGDLVRSMNCYYSNLIEGHNTHPRDIEQALCDNYSRNTARRALQLEARAHIDLQRMIDMGEDPAVAPTSAEYIQWLHREFCSRLPDELLWVENPDTGEKIHVTPGEIRTGSVQVGRHLPPTAEELSAYLARFEEAYIPDRLSRSKQIIAVAASHHRLLWIHPFYDGNGRVARLMSHALLLRAGIGSSLWSVARGLARNVEAYKSALMLADEPRRGDLDGRGTLSNRRLREFAHFFLKTCIDQVDFMESLLQPSELLRRMKLYIDDEIAAGRLPSGSLALLREAFLAGELARGNAASLTGYQERRGRQILAKLLECGLLISQGPRAPVRLGFPIDVVERWFPNLYPVN
jgi:Fic family protein